jgi:rhodanese-related sulfurtransferase
MHRLLYLFGRPALAIALLTTLSFTVLLPLQAQCPSTPNIFQATLMEQNQPATEISTEQLQQIFALGSMRVLDVRFPLEYAISHIPGAINIPPDNNTSATREVSEIMALYPDPHSQFVLTCNGPFCGKSKRVAAGLVAAGYDSFFRYQLGLPVWRALGNTVQTDLQGFAYIFNRDQTAVFVDARTPDAFRDETVACAVNVQPGEATAANDDGRLPLWDKGARVVVFADDPQLAKTVASEIALKAYWSSSYFGGTFRDLKNSRLLQIHGKRACAMGK